MAERPVNPRHRRIYVSMRIPQIRAELNDLKSKIATRPEPPKGPSDQDNVRAHREFIFARMRHQELRKELNELKAEAGDKPKAAADSDPATSKSGRRGATDRELGAQIVARSVTANSAVGLYGKGHHCNAGAFPFHQLLHPLTS